MSASAQLSKFLLDRLSTQINTFLLDRLSAALTSFNLETAVPTPSAELNKFLLDRLSATLTSLKLETAEVPTKTATVSGRVSSFLGAVADAEVTLNTRFTAKTTADGAFTITNVPYGTYTLTVKPTRLMDKLLLKGVSQKIDIYTDTTKIITLPINTLNIGIAGATTLTATLVAVSRKPKPPAW